jgi:hypothetical protein
MHFIFNRRMASASVLQRLNQRAKEAEHMITELKGQIENLRQTAGTFFSDKNIFLVNNGRIIITVIAFLLARPPFCNEKAV